MPLVDLKSIATEELEGLLINDLTKVSTATLRKFAGEEVPPPQQRPFEDAPGFLSRLNESIVKRGVNVEGVLTPTDSETFLQTLSKAPGRALDVTGQAAGLMGDVMGNALETTVSKVTPEAVKTLVKGWGASILGTDFGKQALSALKQGVDAYALFKRENPGAAKHVEAAINIAGVIPFGKATKVGFSAADDVAEVAEVAVKNIVEDSVKVPLSTPFYSRLEEVVEQKVANKMTAGQLVKTLKNNGVSDDEIRSTLSGITEKANDVVKKSDVLDEIKTNKTEFKDVVLSDEGLSVKQRVDREVNPTDYDDSSLTKFADYQEPGAVEGSYRELFVTAPGKGTQPKVVKIPVGQPDEGWWQVIRSDGRPLNGRWKTYEEAVKVHNEMIPQSEQLSGFWSDGHLGYDDIQNPVVRVRYNERNVEGKRILFVEEMQGPLSDQQAKMPGHLRKRIYDIGVKRTLAQAKRDGYDGVAWTPGEVQADRYDLSKVYDKIEVQKQFDDDGYIVSGYKDGDTILGGQEMGPERLRDYIGKELAAKASEALKTQDYVEYTGLNLKIGGEGLKRLYNQTLPAMFKKYGKENLRKMKSDSSEFIFDTSNNDSHDIILDSLTDAINKVDSEDLDILQLIEERVGDYDFSLSNEEALIVKKYAPEILRSSMSNMSYIPITEKTPSSYPMYGVIGASAMQEDEGEARK